MSAKNRILIVDDEQIIREVLVERLSALEYHCDTAPTAAEALKKIRSTDYDLVLSDISMPGGDGISLLRQIKAEQAALDVIMVTGVIDVDTAVRAIRLGASDYLSKPFNLEE